MEYASENKMGTMPVFKLIISMSLPAMFSMLVQSLYNIVDSMYVSRIGEEALTALSLAFPVQGLMIAIAVGTGIGVNSLISRRLGEKKYVDANSAATHGFLLSIMNWIIFAIIGILFTRTFFETFSDNPVVVEMGCDYLYVITIFSFGKFIELNLSKTLQATGNMIFPMIFQLTGAITNIILDPIMIFGLLGFPALGVKGAAIATVTGQILAMILCLCIFFGKKHEVRITLKDFAIHGGTIKNIYKVGLPSIIMQTIMSFLVSMLNAILISFSEAAVAVLGVYFKLQSFVFMPIFGLMQGVLPIMGYNYGARNKKRLMDSLKISLLTAIAILTAGTAIFMVFPDKLLMIFNASEQMLQIGIPALRIISLSFIFAVVGILLSTFFQAMGNGLYSLLISITRQLVITLPAAYLLSRIGLQQIWYAFPIAETAALIASLLLFRHIYNTRIEEIETIR